MARAGVGAKACSAAGDSFNVTIRLPLVDFRRGAGVAMDFAVEAIVTMVEVDKLMSRMENEARG